MLLAKRWKSPVNPAAKNSEGRDETRDFDRAGCDWRIDCRGGGPAARRADPRRQRRLGARRQRHDFLRHGAAPPAARSRRGRATRVSLARNACTVTALFSRGRADGTGGAVRPQGPDAVRNATDARSRAARRARLRRGARACRRAYRLNSAARRHSTGPAKTGRPSRSSISTTQTSGSRWTWRAI